MRSASTANGQNTALISSSPFTSTVYFTTLLILYRTESKNIFLLAFQPRSVGLCFCVLGLQKISCLVKYLSNVLQSICSCWVIKCALKNFHTSTSQIWIELLFREVERLLTVSIGLVFEQHALALSSIRRRSCVTISHVVVLSWSIGYSSADDIPSRWKIDNFADVNYKLRGSNAFSNHVLFLTCFYT
jgi:hypothetical protein